ncbi:acyl-CoA dehydrogenase family protein [Paraliomyxa miuraensis]|uniref:acyl-CoA dehydrogenase family protein n=1 Tax=Paraliomyxa miuraensis TaxID=376150 RepID=UPI002250EF87|nr:acyl-CoA dehydrogenase family protein [Paraliomyxa miuraensis]MCX4242184.1 acyl-CoA dehydrogenase family protein [Paraliomyxa miuraensis]
MKFTDEHEQLRDSLTKFIEREINPHADEWEDAENFPAHELFKKLGDGGFLGVCKPEEYGGLGLDYSYSVVMAETLGRVHTGGVAMAVGVQTDMCTPALAKFGSKELKEEYLAPSIAGELVGCIGVSETGAGSDVAAIKTHARKDGGDWVINGGKMWITNGMQADWMCCLANTSEGHPHRNKSLIIVPLDAKGVERAHKLKKLGMASSDTAQIFFDDVRVPLRNVIGQEGHGFTFQMIQFQEERLWGAANVLGGLDQALAQTIEYTRDRKIFGKSVLDHQWVHFKLAEAATEIECLRALTYQATEFYVSGKDVTKLASMAKLKAGRLAREVADICLQFWGGMGYMHESKISRFFRDGRLVSIGGGADEVMMSIICKLMGTLPRRPKGEAKEGGQ